VKESKSFGVRQDVSQDESRRSQVVTVNAGRIWIQQVAVSLVKTWGTSGFRWKKWLLWHLAFY